MASKLLQEFRDFAMRGNLPERVSVYWDYFNPAYLFFSGGSSLSTATRKAGVFLLPVSVFLMCGMRELWRRRDVMSVVLVAGLVLAPLPATLVGERYAIQRELVVLPFAVLIATPDDQVRSRGADAPAPRDNVILELGLFMGGLGRPRTILVKQRGQALRSLFLGPPQFRMSRGSGRTSAR